MSANRHADVRTSTVFVRTVTMTPDQVTLTLYRQVGERSWADLTDGGEAWGWIGRCPSKPCYPAAHRHVLWADPAHGLAQTVVPSGSHEDVLRGLPQLLKRRTSRGRRNRAR
jgi:hypothetical protein